MSRCAWLAEIAAVQSEVLVHDLAWPFQIFRPLKNHNPLRNPVFFSTWTHSLQFKNRDLHRNCFTISSFNRFIPEVTSKLFPHMWFSSCAVQLKHKSQFKKSKSTIIKLNELIPQHLQTLLQKFSKFGLLSQLDRCISVVH